jgi:UDP-N-acetylglucosamine acyltransferase
MIHPSAVVDSTSELDSTVEVGPNAYIGKNCILHKNVKIGANAVVECHTEIEEGTILHPNAHVGGAPQDLSYKNEDTKLKIGKDCIIREFVTINRASTKEEWITLIGNRCFFMAYSHVGHDCIVGNEVIITNGTPLAGHVKVEDFAILSGNSGVHQFVRIGTMAMIGGMTKVVKDVPPYTLVEGYSPVVHGLNSVGLKRRGIKPEVRSELKKALKIFLNKELLLKDVISELEQTAKSQEVKHFVNFLKESKRGIIRR